MSSAIRELISFVCDRLAVEDKTWDHLGEANQAAWHEAVRCFAKLHGQPIEEFRTGVVRGNTNSPHPSKPSPTIDAMRGGYEWDMSTLGGNDRDSVIVLGSPNSGAFDHLGGTQNKALEHVKSIVPHYLRHVGRTRGGTRISGHSLQRKDSGESGDTVIWRYDQTKAVNDKDTSENEDGGNLCSPTTPDTAQSFTRRRRPVGEPREPEVKFGGVGADKKV
ncbi:hypothetical protein AAF712_014381 [Marasmius tenuissimus]|uniref:Uncharacterized protein n=1 Tax=Marasmius tenuissimus TaxID=585030 RepID=A0ABR2ZEQ1_9AGAR